MGWMDELYIAQMQSFVDLLADKYEFNYSKTQNLTKKISPIVF